MVTMSELIENDAISGSQYDRRKSAWQPIETAPKDGTDILVFAFEEECGFYDVTSWQLHDEGYCWSLTHGTGIEPEFWMPLPPSPTHKAGEE